MAKAKRGFTFDYIDVRKPNYSKHNLSHDHLVAMGSGYLVPLWWTNAVPGDVFNINLSGFIRLLALSSPMLQREDIKVRAFKIPWRILADRKDLDLAYAGDKDGDHIDFPFMDWAYDDLDVGSLADYMGVPLPYQYNSQTKSWSKIDDDDIDTVPNTSIFPVLAYHRIYHDHFRNEETENQWLDVFEKHYSSLDGLDSQATLVSLDNDAPVGVNLGTLHKVGWERDYFTSALSSSQRGSQVNIPLLGKAKVVTDIAQVLDEHGNPTSTAGANGASVGMQTGVDRELYAKGSSNAGKVQLIGSVDGSTFTGIGAIALRMAMNLQAFLERNNVAGYRMIGNILAHFGVRSSNQLHDEAEYLGGISAPITISAVTQTSATEVSGTPQGTQVGQGQSSFNGHLCTTRCEEPCVIMVVGYITAKSSYSQGLARKWSIRNYLDLYWPEFQSVGEQEILSKELYYDYLDSTNLDTVWAYQSRFAEYKYEPDTIAGDFRTTLSYWHQSRLFASLPAFNDAFIKSNPSDRVFALDSETYPRPYLGEFYFDIQAVRPMDKYAVSKLW